MTTSNQILQAALDYHQRGLPITLCNGKAPISKAWQHKAWTADEIRRAFRSRPSLNVGVRLGAGMIDIEADSPEQEQAFAELFEGCDPPITPTFASTRGKHRLYAKHPALAKLDSAVIYYKDLAIRIGSNGKGAQSLLPPSRTDGVTRQWHVSLEECEPAPLPEIVVQRILLENSGKQEQTDTRILPESAGFTASAVVAESTAPSVSTVYQESVELAIAKTLPTGPGQRNRALFEFARHLKAIPALADADVAALKPYVIKWHAAALPYIATKEFAESWLDFANAWKAAKHAAGKEPIAIIFKQALAAPMPAAALQYDEPKLRQLVAFCRELQRTAGEQPFFLACRTGEERLGVPYSTVSRWLQLLRLDNVLSEVTKGKRGKASEYRYLKPLD